MQYMYCTCACNVCVCVCVCVVHYYTCLYVYVFLSCCFVNIRSIYIQCTVQGPMYYYYYYYYTCALCSWLRVYIKFGWLPMCLCLGCCCVCVCVCNYIYRLLSMFVLLLTCINIFCLLSHSNFASLDTRNHLPYLMYCISLVLSPSLSPSLPYPLSIFVIFIFPSF